MDNAIINNYKKENFLMNSNSRNFLYGGISGVFGVCISHPFDTIKTNIQNGNKISIKSNINTLKFLYRGIIPPIIGVGFEKAIVFGTYEFFNNKMNENEFNTARIPIAGALSGLVASFVVTPFERFKILLQTGANINFSYRTLFRGLSATFTRETPGFAIYFSTFEYLKGKTNGDLKPYMSFLYGATAAVASWIFIYPQDKIKTIIQANQKSNITFLSCFKNLIKNGDAYRGFSLALMRAIPLHAATFMMMEILKNS